MAYAPSSRTVNDVLRAVQRKFGDESGVQLETNDIIMWVNEASEEIVKRNRILKATATSATVIGQADYTFPAQDILQLESLQLDGKKLENIPFANADANIISKDSAAASGPPVAWWEWGGTFTFWPTPNAIVPIKLYYTQRPQPVTLVTDTLRLPDKYYKQILDYAMQQAYEMDEEPELSQMKAQQFDAGLDMLAQEERAAQQMTYGKITILD